MVVARYGSRITIGISNRELKGQAWNELLGTARNMASISNRELKVLTRGRSGLQQATGHRISNRELKGLLANNVRILVYAASQIEN